MFNIKLIRVGENYTDEQHFRSKRESLSAMHGLGEKYFGHAYDNHSLTIDMDGVLIHDDNAITTARMIAGPEAEKMFSRCSDLNIKAVAEGLTSYCWYAPTWFVSQLLNGLSPGINRSVGRHMRLIPGARECIGYLRSLGYDFPAITAGHQEAAEEVSRRVGIEKTEGTRLGISDGVYDGTVRRFIGGKHKLKLVETLLSYLCEEDKDFYSRRIFTGVHIGDSWSDVETLKRIPNSLAFNPGCELALINAKISIIGAYLLGLLPFFDYEGKYDFSLTEETLPQEIVVMEDEGNEDVRRALLARSRAIKKEGLTAILDRSTHSFSRVEENIREELQERGIDFDTKNRGLMFLSDEEIDKVAKEAYLRLEQ